jgi:branched-subunit amino acid transport protein AzlD
MYLIEVVVVTVLTTEVVPYLVGQSDAITSATVYPLNKFVNVTVIASIIGYSVVSLQIGAVSAALVPT